MNYFRTKKCKDIAGVIAALVLAIACLVAAAYHIQVLMTLSERGVAVSAVVLELKKGARNSEWAVYKFKTRNGNEVITRDAFQQYIKRLRNGQSIIVIYDRENIETATADLGIWTWQAPAIFLSGFVVMAVLAYLIWRHRST